MDFLLKDIQYGMFKEKESYYVPRNAISFVQEISFEEFQEEFIQFKNNLEVLFDCFILVHLFDVSKQTLDNWKKESKFLSSLPIVHIHFTLNILSSRQSKV